PGFDPRMTDFAYTTTFLAPSASYTLDVATVSSDILSVASTLAIPVSISAPSGGSYRFIGTPDQTQQWLSATLTLSGTPAVNEIWKLTIGGATYSVRIV